MHLLSLFAEHGYILLAGVVFLACCGAPAPGSVAFLAAGTAAARHMLSPQLALLTGIGAAISADTLLYFGGRTMGWWLIAGLCRVSLNHETCIFRASNYFYKRGPVVLMVSKFLPGFGSMAAPLAGSLNMRFTRFLRLDAVGAVFYGMVWFGIGFFFSHFFARIAALMHTAAHLVVFVVVAGLVAYAILLLVETLRARKYRAVERITAEQLAEKIAEHDHDRLLVIADVRSHGYYDHGMQRIKNSIRIEPNRLAEELAMLQELLTPACEVYVYCSCSREATSARVAHMLNGRGYNARVIDGGLKAWKKAGCPTEPVPSVDHEHLPVFD